MTDFLEHFKKGGFLIVADDENRENELDLIIAAEHITEEKMNIMLRWGTGIICVPMTEEIANKLNLTQMVVNNKDPNKTNYTISCDSINCTTGVSAKDRYQTVKDIVNSFYTTNELLIRSPGHMFPLVCKDGLLKERRGHTEAAVQLCCMTKNKPIAVIVELMKDNGEMMRLSDEEDIKQLKTIIGEDIPVITIDDILNKENSFGCSFNTTNRIDVSTSKLICEVGKDNTPTPFEIVVFRNKYKKVETSMLVYPSYELFKNELMNTHPVRIHSECLTGNIFHSLHCDCGEQLDKSMEYIVKRNGGAIIYGINQEGRGIGLFNKIKAYELQNKEKLNTYEANIKLGFEEDERDYTDIIDIVKYLNISHLHLLSNNPDKYNVFKDVLSKVSMVTFESKETELNKQYLKSKKTYGKMVETEVKTEVEKKLYCDEKLELPSSDNYRICIINASWNKPHILKLKDNVMKVLKEYENIKVDEFEVPGSWELPAMCSYKNAYTRYDLYIVIGVLIKGETKHFEYISKSVFEGLMNLQINNQMIIINGVLTVLNEEQIASRYSLGTDWGRSAIKMLIEKDKY